MSNSKNRLEINDIKRLAAAFRDAAVAEICELTAGECNALYKLTFSDGLCAVLKVSSGGRGITRNERWLMRSEVAAMRLLYGKFPVPRLLFYDDSRTLINGSYFFMEFIEGETMLSLRDSEDYTRLDYELGQMFRTVTEFTCTQFGILGSDIRFDSILELVRFMIKNNLDDIRDMAGDAGVDESTVFDCLMRDSHAFCEVTHASLIHYDLWANNVMVKNGKIAAVIDWERALFAEDIMEDKFRGKNNNAFREGYKKTVTTENEMIRRRWYTILIKLSIIAEGYFRFDGKDTRSREAREDIREIFAGILK